ncbi:nuclear transport factor 2 family protein [Sphingobacterium oryzagri]|uniref:Nuclear transport factor 2 family protein n=1 Tax=Sphingobacterium oryzagri TaxID=3025669 RepID=A0ABY7WNV6_9SPHI|nr:nuclear transport factor 2 family protein [Sphingobacterium sp. KACC 22765]WDF70725.1 nuclear transport factor 2 family protein [Sphingobacterium sp. KACC 22765]
MSEQHKHTLLQANAAVAQGAIEAFLSYCTADTVWTFVGEQKLVGKDAVRAYMQQAYKVPPQIEVDELIAEGDWLTAIGTIRLTDEDGKMESFAYCDVWRFEDGMMHELNAFVIAKK